LFSRLHGFAERACCLAYVGPEDIKTFLADGLVFGDTRDVFGSPVEVSNVEI